jgi:hypothetical protein
MLAYMTAALVARAPFQQQIHLAIVSDSRIRRKASVHTQQHQLELREPRASGPLALLHSGGHGGDDAASTGREVVADGGVVCAEQRG